MGQVAVIVTNNIYQQDKQKTDLSESSKNSTEFLLLQRIAARDHDAFHEIFDLYYPRLERFISRLTQNYELMEEVINDVLLVVWQKAHEFKNRSRVSSWIFGIAYNKTLKSIASQARHQTSSEQQLPEQVDPAGNPYTHLAQQSVLQQIQESLLQLSIEHRTVVLLTYIYGYSYIEIAEVMQCPINTVKTRMFHVRKQLQKLLPHFDAVDE